MSCLPSKPLRFVALAAILSIAAAAELRREFKFTGGSGVSLSLANRRGDVTVKPATGKQLQVISNAASDKVEVDARQTGSRIDIRTHALQKLSADEGRVSYEILLPANTELAIDSGDGAIRIENVNATVRVQSDSGDVEVRGLQGALTVQNLEGKTTVFDVRKARVELSSTQGAIGMTNVSGASVTARSTAGPISYSGDFAGGGAYSFSTHSGDIDVTAPASASIEVSARSVKGAAETDFPLAQLAHPSFVAAEGRSIAGTAGAGASAVELRSFSGKIRVKKQ